MPDTFHVVDVLTGAYLGDPSIRRNGWFIPMPEGFDVTEDYILRNVKE